MLSNDPEFLDCLQVGTSYQNQEISFIATIKELEHKATLWDKFVKISNRYVVTVGEPTEHPVERLSSE